MDTFASITRQPAQSWRGAGTPDRDCRQLANWSGLNLMLNL